MLKNKVAQMVVGAVVCVSELTLSTLVIAQTSDHDQPRSFTLDKITVAATLTEQRLDNVASTVSIIDSEQIESTVATDIRELIRYEPAVQVSRMGRFGLSGFTIRGFEGNRVKIVVDGVNQPRALHTGGPFLRGTRNFVDTGALKRVDILKGPASSLYGSDALGGVVAFTTKDSADYLAPGQHLATAMKVTHDSSDNSIGGTLTLAARRDALESLIVYTHRNGNELTNFNDNYTGGIGNDRTKADPQNYDSDNLLVKLHYQLNNAHRVGLSGEYYKATTQTELLSLEGPTYSAFFNYAHYSGDDSNSRQRYSLSHQWQARIALFDKLAWHLDFQGSDTQQKTRNFTTRFGYGHRLIDYSNEEQSLQLGVQFDKTIGEHQLTYGVNYQNTELENVTDKFYPDGGRAADLRRYTPVIEAQSYGVYLQYQLSLLDERLQIIPSIRYDRFEASPGVDERITTDYPDHSSDKWTARLGTVYKFNAVYSIFAQLSQGFKAPDVEQLYHQDTSSFYRGYVILANPDLEPEESNTGLEAGVRANGRYGSFEVSAYYNEYKNFIESDTKQGMFAGVPVSIIQAKNIAGATIQGVEARASLWLDNIIGAPAGTALTAALAYADGEGKKAQQGAKPIDSIAPLTLVLGLNYDSASNLWGGSVMWSIVEKKKRRDLSDKNDFSSPGYGLLDVTGYYQPVDAVLIRAGIYNLTDKEYWVWSDVRGYDKNLAYIDRFTQPGRNISLSVKYTF